MYVYMYFVVFIYKYIESNMQIIIMYVNIYIIGKWWYENINIMLALYKYNFLHIFQFNFDI